MSKSLLAWVELGKYRPVLLLRHMICDGSMLCTVESRVLTLVYDMEINFFPKGHSK